MEAMESISVLELQGKNLFSIYTASSLSSSTLNRWRNKMKNSRIVLAMFLAFAMFSCLKAQEIQMDFDGRSLKTGSSRPSGFLFDIQYAKYGNQISDKTVPEIVSQNLQGKELYNVEGAQVKDVFVKKIIKFKSFTTGKEYVWALDYQEKAYAVGAPMAKSDFEKINFLLPEQKRQGISRSDVGGWEMVSSEEEGEVEEISWDGIKKKICKIVKEIWCRWCCLGAPKPDYSNCVQDCKEVHKKVCNDGE